MDPGIVAELRARHAEPHRAWHGWDRVAAMLAEAEDLAHAVAVPSAFVLAVLFHTAVFDRRRADGPQASAALMRSLAGGTPQPVLERAEALILALGRQELPDTQDASLRGDAALLLDLDHAALGDPPDRFAAYEAAFRREYAHLSDDTYAAGRAAALEMLLWRERVFLTDRFYLEREKAARRNIAGAIARLRGEEARPTRTARRRGA
ncbi:HD domain-containing protein [Falsiroseomonas oryziterrae]|uniref:HD domain-containing protein n=1 Tax=Falsiroseomonas oryziterrae TaxID=2911368 RepID=UPI001F42EB6C|nr:hypothetical protein [Roseomonas sp. NPKOSM-4]